MNIPIPRGVALILLPALLVWPATILWAVENTAIPATTPTSDFTLDDVNGTAYHKKNGLTWKRCAEGQNWDSLSKACTGTATAYTWSAALQQGTASTFAGFDDWHLPNLKELSSIVEQRNVNSAVNATVFPNTPTSYPQYLFWSASPYAPSAMKAWFKDFNGGRDAIGLKSNAYAVRLVRGGQYSLLSVTKAGGGSGTVTSNLPGIDCGPYCKGSFADEMFTQGQIILTATPDEGSTFEGWGEDCPQPGQDDTANQCTVTVDPAADTSVTANFSLIPVPVTLSLSSASGSEAGKTAITVTATASSAVSSAQTVTVGVSGGTVTAGDYTLSSSTITLAAGTSSGSVTFTVVDDGAVEGQETATLTLSNPSSGLKLGDPNSKTITIADNDYTLTAAATGSGAADSIVSGGGVYASGQEVTLTATPAATATFTGWSGTAAGCAGTTNPLTITPYPVGTANPADVSCDGNFDLKVNGPALSIDNESKKEGDKNTTDFKFTVTLSPASTQAVTVRYTTRGDTATEGVDYQAASGTLTFKPRETKKTITVKVNGDKGKEPDETFFVNLSDASGATIQKGQGVGTIVNDDKK